MPLLGKRSLVVAVTTLCEHQAEEVPLWPSHPLHPAGVQQGTVYIIYIGSRLQVLLRDGYIPEDIITTLEQRSGHITTTYAPIGLRSTKESTYLIEK